MQSTTNYSMNLVEGTDIVNIPVQLNPNFQTIDGAMFDNKQASVGTATEVVTGTSHAIVRSNPDSDVFRFTATGAWTAGDTMSVDGNAVTVHLSDGTTPPTGAYIIGAEVLAVINSSLVTLMIGMTPPAQGVTSFNSRTGAVVPTAGDYVAGDIDYDNTISGLTATEVQSAIDELASAAPTVSDFTLAGSTTGTATQSIPNDAKEVLCNAHFGAVSVSFYFLTSWATQQFYNGYYALPSSNGCCVIEWDSVAKTGAVFYAANNGTVLTTSTTADWYVK